MSAIQDDQLYKYASRVKDKVVVITGAANGFGKESALLFAKHGAKVVIGDLDVNGAQQVVKEIERSGGRATSLKCNVTSWDDQVAMFELAISTFGTVDIVVPNAGITDAGVFGTVKFENDKPVKPNLLTVNVNLIGVLYSVHLAQHYLLIKRQSTNELKSIVLIGSMASWIAIPKGEVYSATKAAVLGLMRSLHIPLELQGIRISVVHPFFADTALVPVPVKLLLAGIPLTPVFRVAGAIFYSATDPDQATNGSAWLLPDNGPVFVVPREEFKLGVYKMIDERSNSAFNAAKGALYYVRIVQDIWRVIGKQITVATVGAVGAKLGWDYRDLVMQYINNFR